GPMRRQTLATEAGITRSALYTTYQHLKDEFEQRREHVHDAGTVIDPRDAQIERLTEQVRHLTEQLAAARHAAQQHTAFKTMAVSGLAAQHDELEHLRRQLADLPRSRRCRAGQHRSSARPDTERRTAYAGDVLAPQPLRDRRR